MTNQSSQWQGPLTPWQIVQKRFFEDKAPNAAEFSGQHDVDQDHVKKTLAGEEFYFSPSMCAALAEHTGMSNGFFRNLNEQYRLHYAA